jgi:hypothetical protein
MDPSNRPSAASLLAWFKEQAVRLFPLASEHASNDGDLMGTTGEGSGSLDENMQQAAAAREGLEAENSHGTAPFSFPVSKLSLMPRKFRRSSAIVSQH